MLGISERGFNIKINSDTSVSVELRSETQTPKIGEFLPLKAQRYPLFLAKDNAIPVAPLTQANWDELESHELINMFRQSHIDYVHTKYLSAAKVKENKNFVAFAIPLNHPVELSSGYNYAFHECRKLFAVNLVNMWKTGIFERCLDRLLLVYLRVHLAPEREAKHRKKAQESVKLKKKLKSESKKTRSSTRQLLRRETKYLNKCNSKAQDTHLCDDVRKEWLRRAELCNKRRADLYDSHVKSRPAATRSTDDEKSDNALVTEALDLHIGSLPDAVSVLAELLEDEEEDAEPSKETSSNRIKAFALQIRNWLLPSTGWVIYYIFHRLFGFDHNTFYDTS
ncbi:unnamed protein product [Umbelopsis ramanniana]